MRFGRAIFSENLLGLPSPIQPGDRLLAVKSSPSPTRSQEVALPSDEGIRGAAVARTEVLR